MGKRWSQKYGEWALVTGASSGIGREIVRKLVAQNQKVILVARSTDKLEALAGELGAGNTTIISMDLSDTESVRRLVEQTASLDVGLVAHVAGVVHMGPALDMEAHKTQTMIDLNVRATVRLGELFGPRLQARGKGGMIFVSSLFGYAPVPFVATYAATKSFVMSYAEALAYELKPSNIDVLTVIPGGTKTNMADAMAGYIDFSKMPMPMGDPKAVARAAINKLGKTDRVVPGLTNKMMALMMTRLVHAGAAKKMFGGMIRKSLRQPIN